MRLRGEPVPSAIQWRSIAVASLCMFVATYAALFWAEQYVASGMTSVIEATLPIITVTLEVFVFRQQQFRWSAMTALALGFCGVAILLYRAATKTRPPCPAWSFSQPASPGHSVPCSHAPSRDPGLRL